MSNAVPGFYADGSGRRRWWDGYRWGDPEPRSPRPVWPWFVGGGAALLLILVVGIIAAIVAFVSGVSNTTMGEGSPASVIRQYDSAWKTADCDLLQQITTVAERKSEGHASCDDFESDAQDFIDSTENYVVSVTSSKISGNGAVVVTDEQYDEIGGDSGFVDHYTYTLVKVAGVWMINSIELRDDEGIKAT
jgi:hypothetical protein